MANSICRQPFRRSAELYDLHVVSVLQSSTFWRNPLITRRHVSVLSLSVLFGAAGIALGAAPHTRVSHTHALSHHVAHRAIHAIHAEPLVMAPVLEPGVVPEPDAEIPQDGKKYELKLNALHTGESINVVYRVGNVYIPEALEKLNHFLRDHRTDEVNQYDPKEFDLLHNLMARLGKPGGVVDIVCGYRTPETNELLREQAPQTGVAEHSQHMEGRAIDIRVPGVNTAQLRNAALSLDAGGVGYYPKSQFVHVDVGPVRTWTWGGANARRVRGHVAKGHKTRHRRS